MANERPNPVAKGMPWLNGSLAPMASLVATLLFVVGAILAILFLFLPLINEAEVVRAEAKIMAGDARVARQWQDVEREISERGLGESEAKSRREKVKDEEDKWKAEKSQQQTDLDALRASVRSKPYWYTVGMLIAFVMLALAGLGYLVYGQTLIIRIVGGVLVVAEMVIVFLTFLSGWAAHR